MMAPTASQWNPADYLTYDFRVAVLEDAIAGFAVTRSAGGETELLNLVVAPEFRRRGIATLLIWDLAARHEGPVFLEVRESNSGALCFYKALRFEEVGRRKGYYENPPEGAVVMKLRSCYCHR
jgi:ribosomal-protein-alanine N-acetyltransferase